MRSCAVATAVCLVSGVLFSAMMACSSSPTPSAQPPSDGPTAVPTSAASDAPATTASAPDPTPQATAKTKRPPPKSVAECKDMLSEITNTPPNGGVTMNNANTAADAGSSDRFMPLVDVVKSKRDAFRCCYDWWAKENPTAASGTVMMQWDLKPDGSLDSVYTSKTETTLDAPPVSACMVDVAKGLTYPKSPGGKQTTFKYPFDFKAHH